MTIQGSSLLFWSFVAFPAALCGLFLLGIRRLVVVGAFARSTFRRSVYGLFAWVALWGILGASEALANWNAMPPRLVFALPFLFGTTLLLAFSRFGAVLARHATYTTLIGIQAFRLPLELLLYRANVEGVMPSQMSFAGYNYDVTTGVLALLVLLWPRRGDVPRWVASIFNVLGFALLLVILTIAVASMPMFAAFGPDRTNTWIAYFPYVYLPAIMVQLALLGHVVSIRKLLSAPAGEPLKDTLGTAPNRFRESGT